MSPPIQLSSPDPRSPLINCERIDFGGLNRCKSRHEEGEQVPSAALSRLSLMAHFKGQDWKRKQGVRSVSTSFPRSSHRQIAVPGAESVRRPVRAYQRKTHAAMWVASELAGCGQTLAMTGRLSPIMVADLAKSP